MQTYCGILPVSNGSVSRATNENSGYISASPTRRKATALRLCLFSAAMLMINACSVSLSINTESCLRISTLQPGSPVSSRTVQYIRKHPPASRLPNAFEMSTKSMFSSRPTHITALNIAQLHPASAFMGWIIWKRNYERKNDHTGTNTTKITTSNGRASRLLQSHVCHKGLIHGFL